GVARARDAGDARGREIRAVDGGDADKFCGLPVGASTGGIRDAADVHRGDGQVGADSFVRVAAERDGGADAGERADTCGDDGDGGRVHGGAAELFVFDVAVHDGGDRAGGRTDGAVRGDDWGGAKRHQESARVLDGEPTRIHVRGAGRRRIRGGRVPSNDACVLQGVPVPGIGVGDP